MRPYQCGNVVDWVVFAQVILSSQATNGLGYTGIAVGRGGDKHDLSLFHFFFLSFNCGLLHCHLKLSCTRWELPKVVR